MRIPSVISTWLFILPCSVGYHCPSSKLFQPSGTEKVGFRRQDIRDQVVLALGVNGDVNVNGHLFEDDILPDPDTNSSGDGYPPFRLSLEATGLPTTTCEKHLKRLIEVGLLDDKDAGPENLIIIAQDFVERPEVFSSLLMSDFGLPPLLAHQTRAAVMKILQTKDKSRKDIRMKSSEISQQQNGDPTEDNTPLPVPPLTGSASHIKNGVPIPIIDHPHPDEIDEDNNDAISRPSFKSFVVNKKAKLRRSKQSSDGHDYGLPPDYKERFPTITVELDSFYAFMTRPSTSSQEEPLRPATATVYMRHAKQFLGWYTNMYNITGDMEEELSIYKVFPDKEKNSADSVLEFILWLRTLRQISVSYEANLLRGLTKFLKFRFAKESKTEPSYGDKSFDDIPLIREIRKLHRDANKRQRVAPRSSDESQKWLSWPEYLQVVQRVRQDLLTRMEKYKREIGSPYDKSPASKNKARNTSEEKKEAALAVQRRNIAIVFQRYLVLAIFSSVPDRQRTIRELELDRTFRKDEATGCWCIRHAENDYKTGKSYGERPPLQLAAELTPWVDDFVENWRCCLNPLTEALFVQSRTGRPLTQDSVYQIVSRSTYEYTGKRTNPHLLRDMLVTHVRESDASEKQLEALALYMGHSIEMQRSSYDRRTLTKKVAPAVELLQSVNAASNNSKDWANDKDDELKQDTMR